MATDLEILSWLQRRVAEEPNGGLSWPSGLWSRGEVLGYLNERIQRFCKDTGVIWGSADIPYIAGVKNYPLPQDCTEVLRATWVALDGTTRPIDPGTSFELDLYDVRWANRRATRVWLYETQADVPAAEIRVAPVLQNGGTIRLVYIDSGDRVDGTGQLVIVPDEFIPTIRWGTLEDMRRKAGRGQNLTQANYAKARYELGVLAATAIAEGTWG